MMMAKARGHVLYLGVTAASCLPAGWEVLWRSFRGELQGNDWVWSEIACIACTLRVVIIIVADPV